MPLYGWTKQWVFFIENHETCLIGSTPFSKVNPVIFDLYFHDRDIDYGYGYKGNFQWHILSQEVAQ